MDSDFAAIDPLIASNEVYWNVNTRAGSPLYAAWNEVSDKYVRIVETPWTHEGDQGYSIAFQAVAEEFYLKSNRKPKRWVIYGQ